MSERNCDCTRQPRLVRIDFAQLRGHELLIEYSQKDCVLELSPHVLAVGCVVRVNPGFHLSDAEIMVSEQ